MVGTQFAVFIAGVCGIVPGLGFMLLMLSPHEELFKDRDVFFAFAYGFIAGGVFSIIQWMLVASYVARIENVTPLSVIVIGVLVALVLTLVITFWANKKKFFKSEEAKFIGLAVGCGITTSLAFAKIYADLQDPFNDQGDNFNFYLKNGLYIVSVLLINTAAGIQAGTEISRAEYKLGILKTLVLLTLFYPIMMFHLVYFDFDQQWGFLAVLTVIGALAFLYQYTKNISGEKIPFLSSKGGEPDETAEKKGKESKKKGTGKKKSSSRSRRLR